MSTPTDPSTSKPAGAGAPKLPPASAGASASSSGSIDLNDLDSILKLIPETASTSSLVGISGKRLNVTAELTSALLPASRAHALSANVLACVNICKGIHEDNPIAVAKATIAQICIIGGLSSKALSPKAKHQLAGMGFCDTQGVYSHSMVVLFSAIVGESSPTDCQILVPYRSKCRGAASRFSQMDYKPDGRLMVRDASGKEVKGDKILYRSMGEDFKANHRSDFATLVQEKPEVSSLFAVPAAFSESLAIAVFKHAGIEPEVSVRAAAVDGKEEE